MPNLKQARRAVEALDAPDKTQDENARCAYLAAIVDCAEDAIFSVDLESVISTWNRGAERLLGYSKAEIIGKSLFTLIPGDVRAELAAALTKFKLGGRMAAFESLRIAERGKLIDVDMTVSPIHDRQGRLIGLSAIARDVSERRAVENAFRRSQLELGEAQRLGRVGSWHLDLLTNELTWSAETFRLLGFDPNLPQPTLEEMSRRFLPETWAHLKALVDNLSQNGEPYQVDFEFHHPIHGDRWLTVRGEGVRNAQGQVIFIRGTMQDVTERKRAIEDLRRLNEELEQVVTERTSELQALLDAAPIPIWIAHDAGCQRITGNRYADEKIFQVPPGSNVSASASACAVSFKAFSKGKALLPEELPLQAAATLGKAIANQELELELADGRSVSLLMGSAPLWDSRGQLRGAVAAGNDVTGLRSVEKLNRSILNSLLSSVVVINETGTILAINEAWNRSALENGIADPAQVGVGTDYLQACQRSARAGVGEAQLASSGIADVLAGRRNYFQLEYCCHSFGEEKWFLMTVSSLTGETAGAVIAHSDITARKQAEIALLRSQSTLRAVVESSSQSIISVDGRLNIISVNSRTEQMFGYRPVELIGKPLEILVPEQFRQSHNKHQQAYLLNMQTRHMGNGLSLEARRKDGSCFPVEVALSRLLETASGELVVAFVTDITQRKALEENARTQALEIRALASSLMVAQEEERRRVSRELHDQICQQLALLAFDVGGLVAASQPRKLQKDQLKKLQARIVKVSEETRTIAYNLHPSVLDDLGLVTSLQGLCRDFIARNPATELDFQHEGLPSTLPREPASCIYRVVQEGLQNIARHALAAHAFVKLGWKDSFVELLMEDDGVGFEMQTAHGRGGLGMISMQERVHSVGGDFSISSNLQVGTRLAVRVPVKVNAL